MSLLMALTLAQANRAIDAALAKARDLQAKISVTVCDSGGHLMAHQRMDGVLTEAPFGSIGKAIGAATWGRPDQGASLSGLARLLYTDIVIGEAAPVIRGPGGLPIISSSELEGAIGVSGALNDEQNEECARAGIEVLEMGASSTSRQS
jgi:glc operon protein GlcG